MQLTPFNAGEFARDCGRWFMRSPLTLALIAICCVLGVLAPLAAPTALTLDLMYPNFSYGTRTIVLSRVLDSFGISELVRMLTPILLHAGIIHLGLNMLALWVLGALIESVQSTLSLAFLIVVLALLSNTVQYLYGGSNLFGGMSGVIYGLFSYIWMWQLFDPRKGLGMPASMIWFTLVALIVMTVLDLQGIGNEAHISGFIVGLLYGMVAATTNRILRARGTPGAES